MIDVVSRLQYAKTNGFNQMYVLCFGLQGVLSHSSEGYVTRVRVKPEAV